MTFRFHSLPLLLVLLLRTAAADPAAPPLAVADLFREPDLRSPRVSPDGKYVAFLTTLGTGRVGLALLDLATGKTEPLVGTPEENYEFFAWKGADTIIFGGDIGGNESLALRSIRLSNRRVIELANSFRERLTTNADQAVVLDALRFDFDHVLIFGNRRVGSWSFRLQRLNVRTGKRSPVPYAAEIDSSGLVADHTGAIRARTRLSGPHSLFEITPPGGGRFRTIRQFPVDEPGWSAQFFAADNETLYLLTDDTTETSALRTLNATTGELGPVLFNDPALEIEEVITSYDRRTLYGVLVEGEKRAYHWFDADRAALQRQIDASLPHTFNRVVHSTPDERLLVIHAANDRDPGTFYLLDRNRTKLMALGRINPRVDPARMQPMRPITYRARDGLTIHGYLTLPADAAGRRVPLVVNPHGGPFGIRDSWGFNPEVQFLASRGYAVLQPNFRGSGGYGKTFLRAGRLEWGRRMQDDITDGVRWAIDEGIVDPKRVAIYGASYGGYAALAGITFTPELYRCAVNYVGVSDLAIFNRIAFLSGRGLRNFFDGWVGDDRDFVRERSPVNFVERIRVPTLHAYGENDPRVDIDHWRRLKAELDRHAKPYEYIRLGDEGHGFDKEENRVNFYDALETFLARHLEPGTKVEVGPTSVVEMPASSPAP